MSRDPAAIYAFGPLRLDALRRTLSRGAELIPLNARAFETLLTLIENCGQTVAKDALIEKVWGGAAVEENNLTQSISAIRKALGESRGDHKYIVTLPGRGYRFVAEVEEQRQETRDERQASDQRSAISSQKEDTSPIIPAEAGIQPWTPASARATGPRLLVQNDSAGPPGEPPKDVLLGSPQPTHHVDGAARASDLLSRRGRGIALMLCLIAAASVGYWRLTRPSGQTPARRHPRAMLAVLPFENLSGDPGQDYFSDGLTEEIITQLGRRDSGQLGVIARTSVMRYKRTNESVRRVARELGVGYVVEGSVRRADGRVRISVQLIRASDQTHVWAKSYEEPLANVLALQADVARDVEAAITRRLDPPAGRVVAPR